MRQTVLLVAGAAAVVVVTAGAVSAFLANGPASSDRVVGASESAGSERAGQSTGESAQLAPPALPSGEIVFTRWLKSGGRPSLYVMNPDGSHVRQVVGNANHAAVSPDGRWIAFDRVSPRGGGSVWSVRRDGSGLRRLTLTGALPAWSADGTVVYFSKLEKADFTVSIYSVRSDGTGERVVLEAPTWSTHDGACYDGPAPSPDGRLIAFTEYPYCNGSYVWFENGDELRVGTALVSAVTTTGRRADLPFAFPIGSACPDAPHVTGFAWAPGGQRLAYSVYDLTQSGCDGYGKREVGMSGIYVSMADGSKPRKLAATTKNTVLNWESTVLSWSPHGNWIAFTQRGGIWLVHADGTGLQHVKGTNAHDSSPAWLPTVS